MHISWPSARRGFKDIDPSDVDVTTLFSRIAKENQAEIEAEELGDSAVSVIVKAATRAKAKHMISVLRSQLLYRPGEESVWKSHVLIEPPKDGGARLTVALHPKEGSMGRRAIAAATNSATFEFADISATKTKYKKDLVEALDRISGTLDYTPTGMRMRVQFGSLVVNEWKKDKTEYSLDELSSLVTRAGKRGTTRMINT